MNLNRRDIVLLLIGVDSGNRGIGGITRMQKMLFLLEKEENLKPAINGFDFTAYKAGPYSSKLYDDLEFLENLDLIESTISGSTTDAEDTEIDLLDFDQLIGDGAEDMNGRPADGLGAADAYEEKRYRLTEDGKKKFEELTSITETAEAVASISKVKKKYSRYTLRDLLEYVYLNYPKMTTESEIKDRVLRRWK